jgi:manganese efflux pump family protein
LELLLFGILVGLDNLAVASGLGAVGLERDRKVRLGWAFFAFEALMPLAGLLIGRQVRDSVAPVAGVLGPCCLVACGLLVLVAAWRRTTARGLIDRPWLMVVLPMALSLDNLAAGVGLGAMGLPVVPAALAIGGISGALAVIGMSAGEAVRSWSMRRAEIVAGGLLLMVALVSLLREFAERL